MPSLRKGRERKSRTQVKDPLQGRDKRGSRLGGLKPLTAALCTRDRSHAYNHLQITILFENGEHSVQCSHIVISFISS